MRFFRKKTDYQKQLEDLERSKKELISVNEKNLELAVNDINSTREFYEKMRNHGIRRFDNFLNLCLISSITNTDISILTQNIRLAKHRFEKLLFARMLAMIIIEYLKDINDLLGFKLIGELNSNNYKEFVPIIKDLNSKYASVRKKHETLLNNIRNNVSAHKTKEALNLVQYIYNIDTDEIFQIGLEIMQINIQLTNEGTNLMYKMIAEAEENKKNSH
ncbi:hypothetical protein [Flavobacterium limnophilum]|uniref:hypothetical protein n=1 Tax=Flavobacterium limnophilum TaxID=3003262 RepID=UPI0024825967|nr:hypothetical protein [Flavobacterium limnophilum]